MRIKVFLALLLLFQTTTVWAGQTEEQTPVSKILTPSKYDPTVQFMCAGRDSVRFSLCRDSVLIELEARSVRNSGRRDPKVEEEQERVAIYAGSFMTDIANNGSSSLKAGGKDLALFVLVAAAVVVVGAVVVLVPKLIYDLAADGGKLPVYREAALHYAYSGSNWDGGGSPLYRDTHLGSARFTVGVRRPALGLGLTVEGGYLNTRLQELASQPAQVFSQGGPFVMLGPSVQFGSEKLHLDVEFLNGADFVDEMGWMTEGRFSLKGKVGRRLLVGVYVGSLFYDLRFFDGLIWRRGSFNRDLSLLGGLETGIEF